MKKNIINNLRKGSITVEASFVMPIVIFTIFALIYLSFALHDRCLIQGTVDKVLYKATLTVKHDANIVSGEVNYEELSNRGIFYLIVGSTEEDKIKIENYLQQELSSGLFLSRISSIKVDADKLKIATTVGVDTKVSLPIFKNLFNQYSYLEIMESQSVHNPAETIRAAEVVLETGSSIKGVDELKEKIENFLDVGH